MPRTIVDFKKDCDKGLQSNYSHNTLISFCKSAETTAIVCQNIPGERQSELIDGLNQRELLSNMTDFYLIYDSLTDENKIKLVFNLDNDSQVKKNFATDDFRRLSRDAMTDYIESHILINPNEAVFTAATANPAKFLTLQFELDKVKNNLPGLSFWESSFSMFNQNKVNQVQNLKQSISWLSGLLSGENVDFSLAEQNIASLSKLSIEFNNGMIRDIIVATQNQVTKEAQGNSTDTDELSDGSNDNLGM